MKKHVIILFFFMILVVSFSVPLVFGEEHGGGEGEQSGGAEGGGESREPKAKTQVKAERKTAELMQIQNDVQGLEASLKAKSDNLKKLLEERSHAKDSDSSKQLVDAIEKEYKKVLDVSESLDKKRTQLRFRFPETARSSAHAPKGGGGHEGGEAPETEGGGHGATDSKEVSGEHGAGGVKSLKEFEEEAGLDRDIASMLKTLRSQFRSNKETEKTKGRAHENLAPPNEVIIFKK